MAQNKDRLVFFTSDKGYLVPTIVAARQVAAQRDVAALADIMITLVDTSEADRTDLARTFPEFIFRTLDASSFELPDEAVFHGTHVPRSALARLSAGKIIDDRYKYVVYLDGDIQVIGSILPLVAHDVAEGRLLAAPDAAEIWWPEFGRNAGRERAYVRSLGVRNPRSYFNSGILAATRTGWNRIADEALSFIKTHSAMCRYHDQSALNAIMRPDLREYLSPRYNYNGWYNLLGLRTKIDPAIIHFSGAYKPWADEHPSYSGEFKQVYLDTVRDYPILAGYWDASSGRRGPHIDTPLALGLGWRLPWRIPMRRGRALRQFRSTTFDVV